MGSRPHEPDDRPPSIWESAIYQNRQRGWSFGEVADRYDRARPSYPAALVEDLVSDRPARILDVGCGTGKAARLFAAKGYDVLGVEPDSRMARVAQSHGIFVELATFEEWDSRGRMFNLVIAGQAWHWIDPLVGSSNAAAVLREGGRLATFWNSVRHDSGTKSILVDVYRRHAPSLAESSVPLGNVRAANTEYVDAIAATGMFQSAQLHGYAWEQRYTRDEWLDQLGTHSDHLLLPRDQLAALLDAVGAAIDGLGGSITMHYETELITARRTK